MIRRGSREVRNRASSSQPEPDVTEIAVSTRSPHWTPIRLDSPKTAIRVRSGTPLTLAVVNGDGSGRGSLIALTPYRNHHAIATTRQRGPMFPRGLVRLGEPLEESIPASLFTGFCDTLPNGLGHFAKRGHGPGHAVLGLQ